MKDGVGARMLREEWGRSDGVIDRRVFAGRRVSAGGNGVVSGSEVRRIRAGMDSRSEEI